MGTSLFEPATAVAVVGESVVVSLGERTPWPGDPAFDSVFDIVVRADPHWVIVDLSGIAPPPWLLLRLLRLRSALEQSRDGGVLLVAVSATSLRRLDRTGVSLLFPTFLSIDAALEWANERRRATGE